VDLSLKRRLVSGSGLVIAVVAGSQIASGSYGLSVVIVAAGLLLMANRLLAIAPDVLVAGGILVGYLVGNRGFAQLHPPNLPLLPAEFALGVAAACGAWRWARTKRIPIRRDALNATLLVWIAVSAVRLPLDFRATGLMAVRDFAMVYYALFFFLAQDWAAEFSQRRWLERCLDIGFMLVAPVSMAFLWRPEWFLSLTVAGNPLIFVKGDVAGALMAAAGLWYAERFVQTRRISALMISALAIGGTAVGNSRAALVALAAGMAWLFVLRRWRTLGFLSAVLLSGLAGLAIHAGVSDRPFSASPLYRVYESAMSVVDVDGNRSYSATLEDKPDNNQFRLVWWRTVIDETWRDGPWFGLGFGHDLAVEFLRRYYADANEDFSARSPHNFLLSVFGRTGVVGLLAFVGVLAAMALATWRSRASFARGDQRVSHVVLWVTAWAILTSSCFGVVLEGPMGAIVFWTLLGLANAPVSEPTAADSIDPDARGLNVRSQPAEMLSVP
jgi:O-antigen ligase